MAKTLSHRTATHTTDERVASPGRQFTNAKDRLGLRDMGNIHSVRFRLSATIAILLMFVLVLVGVVVSGRISASLQQETDDRLYASAEDVQEQVPVEFANWTVSGELSSFMTPPDVADLILAGVWVQYFNQNGTRVDWSGSDPGLVMTPEQDQAAGSDESPRVIFPVDILDRVDVLPNIQNTRAEYRTVQGDSRSARVLIYPLTGVPRGSSEPQTVGALVVGLPLESRGQTIELVNETLVWAAIVALVLAIVAGWLTAGRMLSPVKRMTDAAGAIASQPTSTQSLSIRIDVPQSSDEVSHLAATFNTMLSRIEGAISLQRRFVADASHELRTPLTSIRGNVDILLRQASSPRDLAKDDIVESLEDVRRESDRMARLIEDLLTIARNDAQTQPIGNFTTVRLDDVIDDAHATLVRLAEGRNLVADMLDDVAVVGDRDRILQIAIILGENAIRHTGAGGVIEFVVSCHTDEHDRPWGVIEVRDTGEGIAPDHLPHLFERFYRAQDSRERSRGGTGLGLPIALGFVRLHGGWIDVETAPGKGSTFSVYLPVDGAQITT